MNGQARKVIVVGGVAGGATFAARFRRLDENAEIVLFERGEYISFANCGLPYHIGDIIADRKKLLVQTAEGMTKRFKLDIRTRQEVSAIDREKKTITARNLVTGETYVEDYDVLVLSPGASPVRPPIPGIESIRVHVLRNMSDMDGIIQALQGIQGGHAVVVGGGFIGLEVAENLREKGLAVSLVEMAPQVMANIDREMAAMVHNHLRDNDIDLVLSDGVSSFRDEEPKTVVKLASGREIPTDLVVLAIGVKPESSLAKNAGLEVGPRGGILVDSRFHTSDPNIFAVGDAVEIKGESGDVSWTPLAGPANRQARLLADLMSGRKVSYKGALGTSVAKVFDLTVASTGRSEAALKKAGLDAVVSTTHSNSHAAYYPGASMIALKLVFDRTGRILGAQAIGRDGVDKRIDVIAAAMSFGATVRDLPELELAYAPPFGSAKDAVNIAGYVATNMLDGDMSVAYWHEIAHISQEQSVILDVRDIPEWDAGHIPGAVFIPLNELRSRLSELPKDKEIIVYCRVGQRAWVAQTILAQNGFRVRNLSGGWITYEAIQRDLEYVPHKEKVLADVRATSVSSPSTTAGLAIAPETPGRVVKVDATGLQCPGPVMRLYAEMKEMKDGDIAEVTANDAGFLRDVEAWANSTGNTLLSKSSEKGTVFASVRKGRSTPLAPGTSPVEKNDKTIIVFSGDLDKALAAFIIANGAAAMGRKVTMFFTFWGLNILRRQDAPPVDKNVVEKMFGMMMPKGAEQLTLSRMNMGGLGTSMIKGIMREKNVSALEDMLGQARGQGVELIACQMSMDLMGIKVEELADGVEVGGVATMLAASEKSDMTLFV